MNISREHKLAFIISISILLLALFISEIFHIFHLNYYISFYGKGQNKYIIFIILAFLSYVITYFLLFWNGKSEKKALQKLKSYNHNIAHELKTPLSVIKSNLELLEIKYNKDLIKSSIEEVETMKNITDSLLFLSENSSLRDIEKIDILEILNKFKTNECDIKENAKFFINGNRILLESLVRNLLENASKYKLVKSKIDIIIDKNLLKITNKISDDIDIDDTSKLFDTFFKLDNSRSTSGYGLGLSIVKRIVEMHKMKIKIELNQGEFSVFLSLK